MRLTKDDMDSIRKTGARAKQQEMTPEQYRRFKAIVEREPEKKETTLWTVTVDRDDEDRVAFYATEREARGAAQFYVRDGERAEVKPFTVDATTSSALARTMNKVYRRDF